jgi:hypothetical protein
MPNSLKPKTVASRCVGETPRRRRKITESDHSADGL